MVITERADLARSVQEAVDDTDESPWITMPEFHWPYRPDSGPRLYGYHREEQGAWGTWQADAQGVLWSAALGGLGLVPAEQPWLRVVAPDGTLLPSANEEADALAATAARLTAEIAARQEEAAARQAAELARTAAEAELARLRALLEGRNGAGDRGMQ